MTESTAASTPTTPSAKPPSFWEDVIEIFVHPADVFRRRADKSVWPPMLFVAIAIGVISFATFNTLAPMFEAEYARGPAKQLAKNPQMTQEMIDRSRDIGLTVTRYGIAVVMLVVMFVLGLVTWLVSKLVGAKTTFRQALAIAAWAYMPRVLEAVVRGVQGLFLDPSKLTGQLAISLSPARFMDPDTANPILYQLAGRLDLFTLWVTVLLAIGVYVTGRISKERAIVFAVLIWIVGALPVIRNAYAM